MNIEKVTQADLTALKGKSLRLWRFSPTKNMLTYMLPGKEEKYLILLLCETIKTHVIWIVENSKSTKIDEYSFKVEDSDIEIVCQEVIFNDEYFGQNHE